MACRCDDERIAADRAATRAASAVAVRDSKKSITGMSTPSALRMRATTIGASE